MFNSKVANYTYLLYGTFNISLVSSPKFFFKLPNVVMMLKMRHQNLFNRCIVRQFSTGVNSLNAFNPNDFSIQMNLPETYCVYPPIIISFLLNVNGGFFPPLD